jgi:hypothetical protein
MIFSFGLNAQNYTNQRLKTVHAISDTIRIDSLSIIPGSCFVVDERGKSIDSTHYTINYPKSILIPKQKFIDTYTHGFTIVYRVFPVPFSKEYFNKDKRTLISSDSLLGRPAVRYISNISKPKPFGESIETTGSISRGISFGNNQDAVVSSGLNLQISGKLDNNITIEGAISDKTIPFQPQGNTQRLEEFDRIYLRAYTSKFEVQAGDIEIRSRGEGFLKYNRNVQGLSFSISDDFLTKDENTIIKTSAAVAKGKFSRINFVGTEGNQGPYKLTGAEGETFIIVIAGSERVYIDGKLMVRGETNQYTIDYNTAEITFTPTTQIKGSSRIGVEFEYTERSYARFVLSSEFEQKIKNTTIRISAFSEKDSKNQPIDQDFGESQIALLQSIGDNIGNAITPQVDSISYNPDKILYEKKDTTVNSTSYKIYKQSTNPLLSHFQLNFTFMGEGKGNYIPQYSSANGRVYVWVAPQGGNPTGNYEPVRVLVTPKQRQMATIFIENRKVNQDYISSELAISRNDLNTYSSIGNGDDIGEAIKFGFRKSLFKSDTIRNVWITGNGAVTSSNFSFIDRYRPVEFERDWNLNQLSKGNDEKEFTLSFGGRTHQLYFSGNTQGLALGKDYQGFKNSIALNIRTATIISELELSNLNSRDSLKEAIFSRLRMKSDIKLYRMIIEANAEGEDNSQKNRNSGILLPASFRWIQAGISFGLPDSLARTFNLSYLYRKDWKSPLNQLRTYSYSQDIGFKTRLSKRQNSKLNFYSGYRYFTPVDTSLAKTVKKEKLLLSKVDYSFNIGKGFISSNLGYELGSGLEPKYQFYYVEVPAGQGVFTWIDYNGNGIKELDEFEVATYKDEAKFIRINLPSNQYMSIKSSAINIQCEVSPDNLIKDTMRFSMFVRKLSNQVAYSTRQKNQNSRISTSINPFLNSIYDSNLVSISENFRNSMAYNRFSRTFGVEWVANGSTAKQILANGYEIARLNSNQFFTWFGFSSGISLRLSYTFETKIQESEYFALRNFNIKRDIPAIKIRYVGMLGFTAEVGYKYEYAKNSIGIEENKEQTLSSELNYSMRGKSWIIVNSSLSKLDYVGSLGTPIEYEFLKGFKPGTNAAWEIKIRRKLSSYFEMDISYNGRYISTGRFIHTGSMQVRAVF